MILKNVLMLVCLERIFRYNMDCLQYSKPFSEGVGPKSSNKRTPRPKLYKMKSFLFLFSFVLLLTPITASQQVHLGNSKEAIYILKSEPSPFYNTNSLYIERKEGDKCERVNISENILNYFIEYLIDEDALDLFVIRAKFRKIVDKIQLSNLIEYGDNRLGELSGDLKEVDFTTQFEIVRLWEKKFGQIQIDNTF